MLRGSMPALITPFKNGAVDLEGLKALVAWHIAEGSHGLVPVGTTGESPTLSHEEHEAVVSAVVEAAAGRIPIVAGAGSNNTAEALRFMHHAKDVGASAALVVTPYYNKPTQEGIIAHFRTLHDACDLPIVIYNIPGRSAVDISSETMGELAKLPRIIGVKDATGDLARVCEQRRTCGPDFLQISGEDATAHGFNAQGGIGCISVTANVAPKYCSEMHSAWQEKNISKAQEINLKLSSLHNVLFIESSPGPVKYAASLLGLCNENIRLPLSQIKEDTKQAVKNCLQELQLL